MSPGLGSTALTAGKDREGLVPAKTQLHDRRGSSPSPQRFPTGLSLGSKRGPGGFPEAQFKRTLEP